METNLDYASIKKMFRKAKENLPKYEILNYISQSVCRDGINHENQELLLRVLDRKSEFRSYNDILKSLVRKFGLYPYLRNFDLSLSEELVCEIHKPKGMSNVVFHNLQNQIYYTLIRKENVVLSAPTSFGKSLIIDSIISSKVFDNIMIIVPSIALIDETRKRLMKFKDQYQIISFSGQSVGKRNVLILTQERAIDYLDKVNVDFFVIDEFYKLDVKDSQDDNDSREIVLNQVFYKLFKSGANYYLLGPNIEQLIAPKLEEQKYHFIKTDYKTVVSEFHHVSTNLNEKSKRLVELCADIDGQTLIYCQSPGSANKVAKLLLDTLKPEKVEANDEYVNWIKRNYHAEWYYPKYIDYGIGVHHGKIPRSLAQKSVELFNNGDLKFLICTSTLIEGVNTKARNVIIYDNNVNRQKMDFFSFNNICGRSGRMNSYMIGNVYTFFERPQPKLPFVNVPDFGDDTTIIPHGLLINMDEMDLNSENQQQISKYKTQNLLSTELLKRHSYLKLDYLLELAFFIDSLSSAQINKLCWTAEPDYEELKYACCLIWDYLVKSKRMISSVKSGPQLCFKIRQFEKNKSINKYLCSLTAKEKDPDKCNTIIEEALDFMRQWLNFKFPRYLVTLQDVINEVLDKKGINHCNYSYYASCAECFFTKPYVVPFDECGLPIQISMKISKYISDENIDSSMQSLRNINVQNLNLCTIEKQMITDVQRTL